MVRVGFGIIASHYFLVKYFPSILSTWHFQLAVPSCLVGGLQFETAFKSRRGAT